MAGRHDGRRKLSGNMLNHSTESILEAEWGFKLSKLTHSDIGPPARLHHSKPTGD